MKQLSILILVLLGINSYGQTTSEDYFFKGNQKSNAKDDRGAIEAYTKAIELDAKNASAYNNLLCTHILHFSLPSFVLKQKKQKFKKVRSAHTQAKLLREPSSIPLFYE